MGLSIDLKQRIERHAGSTSRLHPLDAPPPFNDPSPEDGSEELERSLKVAALKVRGGVEDVALLASAVVAELPGLITDALDRGIAELEIGRAAVNPLRHDTNPSARLLESIALKLRGLYDLEWRPIPSPEDGVVEQALYVTFQTGK